MELLTQIKNNAISLQKRIVLPEGSEIRTLKATEIILKEKLARIILLGNAEQIAEIVSREGIDITGAEIVDPKKSERRDAYADMMVEIRKSKGLTKEEALKLLNDPLYYGPIMI